MSSNSAIYGRMRKALIPEPALSESLSKLGQKTLSGEITEGRFAIGENGLMSYLITPATRPSAPSVVRVCSVIAKELVLLRQTVRYTMVAELIRMGRSGSYDEMPAGDGYIVIGDIGGNTQAWPKSEWEEVQAFLLNHMRRGGGLVIGDSGALDHGLLNADFIDALDAFMTVKVV